MIQLKLFQGDSGQDTGQADGYMVYSWNQDAGWLWVSSGKGSNRVELSHIPLFVREMVEKGNLVVLLPRDGTLPEGWAEWLAQEMRPSLELFKG